MKFFEPLSTHSLPSFTARVFMAPASLPLPGSVRQKAPSHSPVANFCRKFSFT